MHQLHFHPNRAFMIAGGIIASGCAVWLMASSTSPSGELVDTVVNRIEKTTGAHVDLGVVVLDWSAMHVQAGPITVIGADGSRLASAKSVRFDVAPRQLLSRRLALDNVEIDEPRLSLRIVDNKIAGVEFPSSRVPQGSVAVDVHRLHVRGGVVDVTVETGGKSDQVARRSVKLELGGIDATLEQRDPQNHEANVTISDIAVAHDADTLLLEPLASTIWFQGDGLLATEQVAFTDTELVSSELELEASGTVDLPFDRGLLAGKSPLAVDVFLSGSTNLTALDAALDLPMTLAGAGVGSARIRLGPSSGLTIEGDVDVENLCMKKMRLGRLGTHFKFDASGLALSSARWAVGDAVILGEARAQLVKGVPFEIDATAQHISFYELFSAIGLSRGPWVDARVGGHVKAKGTVEPFVMDGSGKGVITDFVLSTKDAARSLQSEKVITITRPVHATTDIHVDRAGITFHGQLDDELTHGEGSCRLFFDQKRGLLIDATASHFDTQTVGNRISALDVAGAGTATLHVAGPYAQALVSSAVSMSELTLMGFPLGAARGRIIAQGPSLAFKDVVVRRGQSDCHGELGLDFKPQAGTKPPRVSMDLSLNGARAEDLRSMIPKSLTNPGLVSLRDLQLTGPVTGRFHAEGPLGDGKPDGLIGDGLVVGERGVRLWGTGLGGSGLRFHFKGKHVAIDNVGFGLDKRKSR